LHKQVIKQAVYGISIDEETNVNRNGNYCSWWCTLSIFCEFVDLL